MTNLGVRHGYKDLGIDFIETDVGDRFVMQQMQKSKAVLSHLEIFLPQVVLFARLDVVINQSFLWF
jgi:hypothetical protein